MVRVDAAALGLGEVSPIPAVADELAATRATVAQLEAEQDEAAALVVRLDDWKRELASLDDRIDRTDDDTARWEWMRLRRQLDGVRAELAAFDGGDVDKDSSLLDSAEDLRATGETWAEADAAATELRERLGPLPDVSEADLDRVAAHARRAAGRPRRRARRLGPGRAVAGA